MLFARIYKKLLAVYVQATVYVHVANFLHLDL